MFLTEKGGNRAKPGGLMKSFPGKPPMTIGGTLAAYESIGAIGKFRFVAL
jgi:hypothetical protein